MGTYLLKTSVLNTNYCKWDFDLVNYTTHHQPLVEGRSYTWKEVTERGRVEVGRGGVGSRGVKDCPLAFNY